MGVDNNDDEGEMTESAAAAVKTGLRRAVSCGLTDCIGGTVQTHLTTDNGQPRSLACSRSIIENDETRDEGEQTAEAPDFEIRYFCRAIQKTSRDTR